MKPRKVLMMFLCTALLCSCGSVKERETEPVKITYATPKPFYLSADEDNVYVLAAGMEKYCPDGNEDEKLETAVQILKKVKSPKYPDNLRGVIGEIFEKPTDADMEMAEEILIFGVEQSYKDSMTE